MNKHEFKVIPKYEDYAVTRDGTIKAIVSDTIVTPYIAGGYLAIKALYNSPTKVMIVSRAVALTWVNNPDPQKNTIVNHIDGDKLNNWYENLEWTTYSGNNFHAVNTGLRPDNIPCKVRDFDTGIVTEFPSMAQASEFMGLRKDTPICGLLKKKFGALISNKYEFKFSVDNTPWFYENRDKKVSARFMVIAKSSDGEVKEVYSQRNMLKEFQLYYPPYGSSIPNLVKYAREKYPDWKFTYRDAYTEKKHRVVTSTVRVPYYKIKATKGTSSITFPSQTQAAKYFGVDRSVIKLRLENGDDLNGFVFSNVR